MLRRTVASVYDWLDQRLPARRFLYRLLYDPVPERGGWWYTLGAAIFVLLIIQVVTGIFLMMYYVPSWDEARESVLFIETQVFMGSLVRGIHYWNMVALVLLVGLHMARTFLSSAHKTPREITWVLGVTLLLLMVGTAFTGGILRWDQSGYFDVVVGTTIAGWTPVIGQWIAALWRGGDTITPLTLTRSFAFHVWLLPVPLLLLATIHIALVVIQGQYGSWVNYEPEPPDASLPFEDDVAAHEKVKREVLDPENRKVNVPTRATWFYPYHVFKEGVVATGFFVAVFLAALFIKVPVEEPVDPSTITYAPTSMWFFLFIDQLFLIFPGAWLIPAGANVAVGIVIAILYLLPWIDRSSGLRPRDRPVSLGFMFLMVFSILALALLAASRVYNYDYINRPM